MACSTRKKQRFGNYSRLQFGKYAFQKGNLADLMRFGRLTYYHDFSRENTGIISQSRLNAIFSRGSPVATFVSARSATSPATYVDDLGIVRTVTNDNVGRVQGGYYDATGFHAQKGLMIEAAGTNLLTYSSVPENAAWTKTNITAEDTDAGSSSPDGTGTAPSLTATGANGTFLLAANTATNAQTYSVWIKRKTGTGTISITADSGANYTAVTVLSGWARFTVTAAAAAQKCGIKIGTSGDAVYIWCNQFENNPYATSAIPTVASSLSRAEELLSYSTSGNRTAASESMFCKFVSIPSSTEILASPTQYITITSTKGRAVILFANLVIRFRPNATDNTAVYATDNTAFNANTKITEAFVCQHSSPYASIYRAGTLINSYTAGDWTNPAWGDIFWFGSTSSGGQAGIILKVIAIFSDAKNATFINRLTSILEGP